MIKTVYLTVICLLSCSNLLHAQKAPAWGGGADVTDLSFGFSFTYVSSYLKINKQPDWQLPFIDPETGRTVTGEIASISSPDAPGFAVGFLTRYRINDHLEVRTTPSLVFADRKLIYKYQDATVEDKVRQITTTAFDIPLQLKLKSDRIGDFRGYLIGGAKITAGIGSKKNDDKSKDLIDKLVKTQQYFASYEAGIGLDIYFEFFKLSPEIKISNSFGNILRPENHPYSRPLSGLALHTVQFSLYFE
ncbi:PorT family protein [Mucilaginibacter hurinus]|uniref:PorT family protein n=1 Tax=Mucilaginibacter hurinus TaxID=2201324 RepID=A0A367GV33_9SPHI|nr:outer membrane beta-barrel protein [Mucilaginibacter hurinus]RCH56533.1 PorT family protein [Mucilaginibacter hurinus]